MVSQNMSNDILFLVCFLTAMSVAFLLGIRPIDEGVNELEEEEACPS